jgi:hypothetical protein
MEAQQCLPAFNPNNHDAQKDKKMNIRNPNSIR